MRLTALQRNIKALGTFAFQVFERRHRVYARYIPRTLRHIGDHLRVLADPRFDQLAKYFSDLS
jgi:aminoglycoside/choline kinase family phosphotransferase